LSEEAGREAAVAAARSEERRVDPREVGAAEAVVAARAAWAMDPTARSADALV
jgi:hypothetical protein